MNETASAVCAVCILLAPLAAAGIALVNAGLGRARNAAHMITASLCAFALAGVAYFAIGFGIQAGPFFFRGINFEALGPVPLSAWLQLACVGLASLIPLGGGGGRWRLGSICTWTAIFAGILYPIFARWVWGGGWLAQWGFVDVGGSGVIHCSAGSVALVVTWMMGPRTGKFSSDGMPLAIPGHNVLVVLFGCALAMIGWIGLNEAGAMLYADTGLASVPLIGINTLMCAGCSLLAAAGVTRLRFGKPDASLTANGWVAGLVASSASCAFVRPAEAVIIGLVAGGLTVYSIELLELRLGVDDPGGVISVHLVGGLWGLLAMGLLGRTGRDAGQFVQQLIGIATLMGFVFPVVYVLNWALNRLSPYRVAAEGEWQGLDLYELGAGAYPEFVSHGEEFMPR